MAEPLYRDPSVTIVEDGIIIPHYYFPIARSRRIFWAELKSARLETLSIWDGKLKLWGMGLKPYWFNWDWKRPAKRKFIALDTGNRITPAITPDEPDIVYSIINEKLSTTEA